MKIEIKWLNNEWHAFVPNKFPFLASAGITDICDQVRDELRPHLAPGEEIQWEARDNKLIAKTGEAKQRKLSKSDDNRDS